MYCIIYKVCSMTFFSSKVQKSFLSGRIVTHEGNMNPLMGEVDMVPDDDLNTRLKFYVSTLLNLGTNSKLKSGT